MTTTVPPQRSGSDVRDHAPSTTAALEYFARQIRGFRQQLSMSQSEIQSAFGVDKVVWGSYERGDRVPTLPAFLDLCARTGLHWEELLPPSEDTGPRVLSAEERAQVLRETADMIVARDGASPTGHRAEQVSRAEDAAQDRRPDLVGVLMGKYEKIAAAMAIFKKYEHWQWFSGEHDVVFAGPNPDDVSEDDITALDELGWYPNTNGPFGSGDGFYMMASA